MPWTREHFSLDVCRVFNNVDRLLVCRNFIEGCLVKMSFCLPLLVFSLMGQRENCKLEIKVESREFYEGLLGSSFGML